MHCLSPLQLEDRIRLRQVLGAAQEPFDAPLVLKDLRLLAERRRLDLSKGEDIDLLLADLPIELADKAQKQLKLIGKWRNDVIRRVAIEHDDETGVLGIDMLKELDDVVNAVKRNHPNVYKALGENLREKTLEVYFGGNLRSKGQMSQDALRDLRKLLKDAPKDDQRISQLFNGDIRYPRFKAALEAAVDEASGAEPIREYIGWAASYTGRITADQRQLLQHAIKLSKGLLDAEEAVPASA